MSYSLVVDETARTSAIVSDVAVIAGLADAQALCSVAAANHRWRQRVPSRVGTSSMYCVIEIKERRDRHL